MGNLGCRVSDRRGFVPRNVAGTTSSAAPYTASIAHIHTSIRGLALLAAPYSEAPAAQGRLLALAVRRRDIEPIQRRLQESVHPDTLEDRYSGTPLSSLIPTGSNDEYELAVLLLEFGADPNAEDGCGTLVHTMTRRAGGIPVLPLYRRCRHYCNTAAIPVAATIAEGAPFGQYRGPVCRTPS